MEIQFKGANCLTVQTKTAKVVIDDNLEQVGLKKLADKSDIALYSQKRLKPEKIADDTLVLDGPGEYEAREVSVHGLPARAHTDEEGKHNATIFRLAYKGTMMVSLGHIYPELTDEQLERIGMVDIVALPVGGNGYTLDAEGAAKLIKQIEPKIVIPTHYADSAVKYEVPQNELDLFMKELGATPEKEEKLKIKSGIIPDNLTVYQLERTA